MISCLSDIKELLISSYDDSEILEGISMLIYGKIFDKNTEQRKRIEKIFNFKKSQLELKLKRYSELISIENKNKSKQEKLNILYFKHLNRFPSNKEKINDFRDIQKSLEFDANETINKYFETRSFPESDILMTLISDIFEMYQDNVYYHPNWKVISKVLTMYEYGFQTKVIKDNIERNLKNTNDFKHLERCRRNFRETKNKDIIKVKEDKESINIRWYLPVGLSGYANVAKNLVKGLFATNKVNIDLRIVQFHNYNPDTKDPEDELLANLSTNTIEDSKLDVVIIHSQLEFFPIISKKIRKINSKLPIYGITVWETKELPVKWKLYTQYVDHISVPSEFSRIAFDKTYLPQTSVVHHPVKINLNNKKDKNDDIYRFYNISEFSARKNVCSSIEAFILAFKDLKECKVEYIIKASGPNQSEYMDCINNLIQKYKADHLKNKIILIWKKLKDSEIEDLHTNNDCYFSLTKAEGHGIGCVYSALLGNHSILPDYSGYVDYFNKINEKSNYTLLPTRSVGATFCPDEFIHKECKEMPCCQTFHLFIPSQTTWVEVSKKIVVEALQNVYNNKTKGKLIENNPFTLEKCGNNLLVDVKKVISNGVINKNIIQIEYESYRWIDQKKIVKLIDDDLKIDIRPKVLIINAANNANVGDDMYNIIAKKIFDEKEINVKYTRDNMLITKDDQLKPIGDLEKIDKKKLFLPEYAILLGGGLLNKERVELLTNYKRYLESISCQLFICSVGFQDIKSDGQGTVPFGFEKEYKEILDYSSFISLRTYNDVSVASRIMNYEKLSKLCYHPDLVYSLSDILQEYIPKSLKKADEIGIMMTADYNCGNTEYLLDDLMKLYVAGKHLNFINFAGVVDKTNQKVVDNMNECRKIFPLATFMYNMKPTDNLMTDNVRNVLHKCDFTFDQVIDTLSKCEKVYSSRYHGIVIAKALNVREIIRLNPNNYKIREDLRSHHDIIDSQSLSILARKPLDEVIKIIKNGKIIRSEISEDQRNTMIVDLNNKTGLDIKQLQSMDNFQLQML